jgi:two-component system sensor histidine kinase PilS (NtrC family)
MKKAKENLEHRNDLFYRLQWLMFLRVVVITFLLGATVLIHIKRTQSYLDSTLFCLYLLIGITYFSTFVYILLLRRVRNLTLFAYIQIIGDIFIESALVVLTGGIESIFSSIYILSIITASILLFWKGGLIIASLSSLSYGALVDLEYYGFMPVITSQGQRLEGYTSTMVLYTVLVNIMAFYIVAVLSSYLSEQTRKTKLALQEREYDLEELAALNEHIVHSLNSGLLTMDLDGRVTFFNKAAEEITGYSLNEIRNQKVESLFPDSNAAFQSEKNGLQMGIPSRRICDFFQKDKTLIHLGFSLSPLKDSKGERTGTIMNFQDVTGLIEMEEHLKQVDRLASIGEMAARIAHEIRNPLASISGSIQLLEKELDLGQTNQKLMDIVLRETNRLNILLMDFLLFARPQKSIRDKVDLPDLIQETIEAFEKSRDGREDIKILADLEEHLIIDADPRQLRQVFWNLFINAGQSMPHGGTMNVSAHKENSHSARDSLDGEHVKIVVKDTGCGIDQWCVPKIFDPFFTTKEKGTGLGLSVVYRIIEGFNGRVGVESKMGTGTSFTISIPC